MDVKERIEAITELSEGALPQPYLEQARNSTKNVRVNGYGERLRDGVVLRPRWSEVTRREAIEKGTESVCENILRIALFVLHKGLDDCLWLVQRFQ